MADLLPSRATTVVVEDGLDPQLPTPRFKLRNLLLFCWALLAIGTAIGAWTIATPLMAAPDEPAAVVQAAAAVRGQLDIAEHQAGLGPEAPVRVPAWVASIHDLPLCFFIFQVRRRAVHQNWATVPRQWMRSPSSHTTHPSTTSSSGFLLFWREVLLLPMQ